MDFKDYLEGKADLVDERIEEILSDINPAVLEESSKHLVKAGGKRVRPVLVLACCDLVGGDVEEAVSLAASIELLHTFTLIHDDIIDEDEYRRGEETVHEKYGKSIGIISGDVVFAKVFETVAKNLKDRGFDLDKFTKIFEVLSEASYNVCEGQFYDIDFEGRDKVTEDEYKKMVEGKTGAILSAAADIGGLLGGGSEEELEALRDYGRLVGTAFQIRDDLIEVEGNVERSGKSLGSDFGKGKWTFLNVKAFELADSDLKEELLKVLQSGKRNSEREKMIEIYEETGAIQIAKEYEKELIEEAKEKLNIFPDSESKDFLLSLADFTISRKE